MILMLALLVLHLIAGPDIQEKSNKQLRREIFRQQLELINERWGR